MRGAKKLGVVLQIAVVCGLIGFATWQLFLGNFAASMATFPLLVIYWLSLGYLTRQR